ncbi:hypothetical protein QFC19_007667 [Naganishia cerealis]|uniref:Uncharacterized protein n=1 Tax=Naganishia cerealis TaxID=610337 RepID=A0ACC2V7E6_9TREE|nr:hypothetical protein QFC19_007667 [Naganishia cerealis]
MAPVLKILHPEGDAAYPPVEPVHVNSTTPVPITTNAFDGEMSVWVKDYRGLQKKGDGMEYFGERGRESMTYGIVVRDDILFGNVFEKPIRASLPWGTSIAMRFINWVDPNVAMDPYADKPWALLVNSSPTLASMNYLSLQKVGTSKMNGNGIGNGNADGTSKQRRPAVITEDSYEGIIALRRENVGNLSDEVIATPDPAQDWGVGTDAAVKARRRWLTNKENRQSLVLDENWEVGMEFCNGLLGKSLFQNDFLVASCN